MTSRAARLRKLLALQEQLKALHETRHAGFTAEAAAARDEAAELVGRFNLDDSLSGLFPEIYHRRIGEALSREEANRAMAESEAAKVVTAKIRTNMVEREFREVRLRDEREKGDRERLELIAGRADKTRQGK